MNSNSPTPPTAQSALTLRAWLAGGALVGCVTGIIATITVKGPVALVVLLAVVGVTALVDSVVIAVRRRQRPREPSG